MQFADTLRDARTLSGGAPQYAWVRAWNTPRGVPLFTVAEEAAGAAGTEGLLALWLHGCAQAFRGRYTIDAAGFARAMDSAADVLFAGGAVLFPAAVRGACNKKTFAAWSAAAYAGGIRMAEKTRGDERVFWPWLCAMYARFAQE